MSSERYTDDSPSPWNEPDPQFKPIPETNPKTGKATMLYICSQCGAAVANRKLHIRFHNHNSII